MKASPPSPRLASIDRSQLLWRPVDVERLIDEDHSARSIWQLIGRLDLSLHYAEIAAGEGSAGRDHTAPQLLISLWLYGYSRGISSAVYAPDVFVFDAVPPREYPTWDAYKKDWEGLFTTFPGPIAGSISDLNITVVGSVVYTRYIDDGTFTGNTTPKHA